jgi:hypothetical protein
MRYAQAVHQNTLQAAAAAPRQRPGIATAGRQKTRISAASVQHHAASQTPCWQHLRRTAGIALSRRCVALVGARRLFNDSVGAATAGRKKLRYRAKPADEGKTALQRQHRQYANQQHW